MLHRFKPGFSILELLIVLGIVGILGTAAAYTLRVSRADSRDAKRVSDISVLRSALSQYWLQKASYPLGENLLLGKPGSGAVGLTTNGFVGSEGGGAVILPQLPIGPKTNDFYRYTGTANGYSLKFTTERATAYGVGGTYYAHASGIDQKDEVK